MKDLSPLAAEVVALLAQGLTFTAGLALSLVVGMALAAFLDGPGGLLVATVVAGTGLLVSAALSQAVHDNLIQRGLDA